MSRMTQSVEPQGREAELEMELGAEELLALSQAPGKRATAPALAAEPSSAKRSGLSRLQIGAGAASVVAVLIGFALDRSPDVVPAPAHAAPVAPSAVASLAPAPAPPVAEALPVKFANPFDRSEVFEFPPGTSRAEARAKVADLLLKRAQERRVQYKRPATRHTRVASR